MKSQCKTTIRKLIRLLLTKLQNSIRFWKRHQQNNKTQYTIQHSQPMYTKPSNTNERGTYCILLDDGTMLSSRTINTLSLNDLQNNKNNDNDINNLQTEIARISQQ